MNRPIYPIIQKPCPKSWDSLPGDTATRHCSECRHEVHNLDEMSPAQRQELLRAPGRKCVAYTDSPEITKVSIGAWNLLGRLRLLRPITVFATLVLALFGTGCATTYRKDTGSCPPTLHDKPNTSSRASHGEQFKTVGVIVVDRPLWKRILHIE